MVAFAIGKPITTDVPGIEVDGLPAGSHRFQLVVEDNSGVRSQPDQIVVLARGRVLPPVDPPIIVRPPVGGPVVDPVRPPVTGPVIGPGRPPVVGPVIAGPVIAGPVTGPLVNPVRPVVVSPLIVRDAGPMPPPPPKPPLTPSTPARKSKRRKP